MNESPLNDLESRLRQDAEQVLETQSHAAPVAELLRRHDIRSRRRILVRNAGLALLVIVLPAAWFVSGLLRSPARELAVDDKTTPSESEEKLVVESPRSVPESGESIVPVRSTEDPDARQPGTGFIPIVMTGINADGEQISIPAWYLPERSESIDFSQLSPAQQRAVREVLGLKDSPENQRPI